MLERGKRTARSLLRSRRKRAQVQQFICRIREVAMARIRRPLVAIFALAATILLWMSGGCGSNKDSTLGGDDSNGQDASTIGDDGSGGSSSGTPVFGGGPGGSIFTSSAGMASNCPPGSPLSCYVNMNCAGGAQTTLSGKVYDPAGKIRSRTWSSSSRTT